MNKADIYRFLSEKGIPYEKVEHQAVFTVEEADTLHLPHPEAGAKNLFLRDDKKQHYYLLTVRDHRPVNLKHFQNKMQTRRLSFASEEDLSRILGLTRGSVTPFGVLNDEKRLVTVFFDAYFERNIISVHPNENTATVYLAGQKLADLLREHGNAVSFIVMEDEPASSAE